MARNFINVVSLASSKYVWMIGDDDLLLPDTLTELIPLLSNNPSVDFFYINAYHLSLQHINKYPALSILSTYWQISLASQHSISMASFLFYH